jgi:hypothetical protein
MVDPAGTQRLESSPAIAHPHGDTEDIAEFAVEVAQIALRVVDDVASRAGARSCTTAHQTNRWPLRTECPR